MLLMVSFAAPSLLHAGVNDLGGTLINENISRASGADHGQETTEDQFIQIIESENKNIFCVTREI